MKVHSLIPVILSFVKRNEESEVARNDGFEMIIWTS